MARAPCVRAARASASSASRSRRTSPRRSAPRRREARERRRRRRRPPACSALHQSCVPAACPAACGVCLPVRARARAFASLASAAGGKDGGVHVSTHVCIMRAQPPAHRATDNTTTVTAASAKSDPPAVREPRLRSPARPRRRSPTAGLSIRRSLRSRPRPPRSRSTRRQACSWVQRRRRRHTRTARRAQRTR